MVIHRNIKTSNEVKLKKIMFSGNPLILFLGGVSILIFFTFLRTRASKKQMHRNNRVNYSWYWSSNKIKKNEENIIDGEAEEIKDDKDN